MGYIFKYLCCSYIDLYVYIQIPCPSLVSFQGLRLQQKMNVEGGVFLRLCLLIYLFTSPHEPYEPFATMKKLCQ